MNDIFYFVKLIISEVDNYIESIIHSYRFRRAMQSKKLQSISLKNETVIYQEIICAVDIHRKAMQLVFMLECAQNII